MKLNCNNKEYEIDQGQSIYQALKAEIDKRPDKEIITCNFNNEIKSLNYKPSSGRKSRTIRL